MNENNEIKRFTKFIIPSLEKGLECAYYTGKNDGENEFQKALEDELNKRFVQIFYSRAYRDLNLFLWLVIPKEFLTNYKWLFYNFDNNLLDLICEQIGNKTFEEAIEESDYYEEEYLKRQRRIMVEFFRDSDIEIENGYKPMTDTDFDFVVRNLMLNRED